MKCRGEVKWCFREMERCYGEYAGELAAWIAGIESTASAEVDGVLASLARMEEAFIAAARRIGERTEKARAAARRELGRELSLYESSIACDAEREFEAASAAVHQVASLRIAALREVEKIREGLRREIEKNDGALKLGKKYTRGHRMGRRVDGKV